MTAFNPEPGRHREKEGRTRLYGEGGRSAALDRDEEEETNMGDMAFYLRMEADIGRLNGVAPRCHTRFSTWNERRSVDHFGKT